MADEIEETEELLQAMPSNTVTDTEDIPSQEPVAQGGEKEADEEDE